MPNHPLASLQRITCHLSHQSTHSWVEVNFGGHDNYSDAAGNWDNIIPFFPVPAGDPQGDLHDQRHRVLEHGDAQVHAEPADFSERRCGAEGPVHGHPGSVEEVEVDPSLEACIAELPGDVRRGTRAAGSTMKTEITQFV